MRVVAHLPGLAVLPLLLSASALGAQAGLGTGAQDDVAALRIDGPPPPVAPAVITRDDRGNATVRAIRLTAPIRLDGVLSEPIYREVQSISDFVQVLPDEGDLATEKTEAWILFDGDNVYVAARVWDSAPESEWVANELRRNVRALIQNDNFGVSFDTFYDRRNASFFYVNPIGARADVQHTNEGNTNRDWNPIWNARTGRFEGGWTVEMEIPFKSLRYRPGREQIWGVQLRRAIRRKNEWTYLTQVPRSVTGGGGSGAGAVARVSRFGTLIGLEAPPASRALGGVCYPPAGGREFQPGGGLPTSARLPRDHDPRASESAPGIGSDPEGLLAGRHRLRGE